MMQGTVSSLARQVRFYALLNLVERKRPVWSGVQHLQLTLNATRKHRILCRKGLWNETCLSVVINLDRSSKPRHGFVAESRILKQALAHRVL
jgi:hypothetical protein